MQKGILLEVEGKTGIVLTPTGEFRRVPLPAEDPVVGDEILVPALDAGTGLRRWARIWAAAAAAVLLAVLAPVGYWHWSLAQPAALVMIDINPSIQLTVNGRRHVVEAEGLNADGQEVLDQIEWRRRPVEAVTRAIAAQAIRLGKLNPAAEDNAVVVAVAPLAGTGRSAGLTQSVVEQSRSALQFVVVQEAESQGAAPLAGVAVVQATPDEVEEARRQDLTVPRLIILEEVQADHPEVTADAIRDVPPGQFLKSLGIDPGEVFSRAEQRRAPAQPAATPAAAGDRGVHGRADDGREERHSNSWWNLWTGNSGKDSSGKGDRGKDKPGKDSPGKGNPGAANPGKSNPVKDGPGAANPGKSNPVKDGPGKDNPGKSNPVKDGPGAANPGKSNPVKDGPGAANPGKSNPVKDGPGKDNPGKSNPGKDGPGKDNPGKSNPVKDGPGKDNPGKSNPGKDGPGAANPGKSNPGKDGPGKDNPGKSNPGKDGPGKANPGKSNPGKDGPGKDSPGNGGAPQGDSKGSRLDDGRPGNAGKANAGKDGSDKGGPGKNGSANGRSARDDDGGDRPVQPGQPRPGQPGPAAEPAGAGKPGPAMPIRAEAHRSGGR
ncbi:anti-sigma factor domain-containing protein [Symbiobacterium thermophilum]|nr:anti-sigma factor domain-containing protein [Symbiobacterium thermophilum]